MGLLSLKSVLIALLFAFPPNVMNSNLGVGWKILIFTHPLCGQPINANEPLMQDSLTFMAFRVVVYVVMNGTFMVFCLGGGLNATSGR